MKKMSFIIVSIIFIPIILLGCQSTTSNETTNDEISEISIANSTMIGKMNTEFFVTFEDKEILETFQYILENAVQQEGIVDIIEPDFDLEVLYKDDNEQEYHLWLGKEDEKSTLMNMQDTHTVYSISRDSTNQLKDLIK